MRSKLFNVLMIVALLSSLVSVLPVLASPPSPDGDNPSHEGIGLPLATQSTNMLRKQIDQPNRKDYLKMRERLHLLEAGQTAEAAALAQTGEDRVLVVLVEFAGTDVFTWNAPTVPMSYTTGSQWDPIGQANPDELVTDAEGNPVPGDCSKIITQTTTFTYTGPLHNQIPRPLSATDRSGDAIWTTDFNPDWFKAFMFGNGVHFQYARVDNSQVDEDFTGMSVKDYYSDLSNGTYTITGDVVGWLSVPHSTWYYDADQCPGSRSGARVRQGGVIPGAGNTRTLVRDALDAVDAISNTLSWTFDWSDYDKDGNGIIDRLWIVHAGYGEEESTVLMNRTNYGESAVWSHSSQVTPPYSMTADVAAGPYIVMPENGGIGVFAHEYGHNLGAWDLYSYQEGNTSAGFWTLMSDDWTGYPIGFQPPAMDPTHLDLWGWLHPYVITDTTQSYDVYLGQASEFDANTAPGTAYRAVKIALDEGQLPLAAEVWSGNYYWWGGKVDQTNAMMTSKNKIAVAAGAKLTFDLAYETEDGGWDFLWVQVSEDGTTWDTLANAQTQCEHDSSWIGAEYGFPDDLCAAGIGGFYGHNAEWPAHGVQEFDLADYANKQVYLRFWYMTDWATSKSGVFVDNVKVGTVFSDDAESGDANWDYDDPWQRNTGKLTFSHNYYLQWRNVNENGGYDSALGDDRFRFGPANTGLVVWYNNNFYSDNEIDSYLVDDFSLGPKGNSLVIDSQPEPYRDPNSTFANSRANASSRGQMRDAPFTLVDTVDFDYKDPYDNWTASFEGRPAVNIFNDAHSYYPGVELTHLSPTSAWWYYVTKMWDASAVLPARAPYSVKGPAGYPYGGRFARILYRYNGGWFYLTPDAVQVGSGAPDKPFGWRVELLEEGADHTWAKVRVYNTILDVTPTFSPEQITVAASGETYTITYQTVIEVPEAGNDIPTAALTYTLDSDLTFVSIESEGWRLGTGAWPIGQVFPGTRSWHTRSEGLLAGDVVTITLLATWTSELPLDADVLTTQLDAFDGDTRGPWHFNTQIVAPTIAFDSPTANQVFVPANGLTATVPISVVITDFELPTDGHWQLQIDAAAAVQVTTAETSAQLGVGTHYLTATLVAPDNQALGPVDTVSILVGVPPVANFAPSATSVNVGDTITFTNTTVTGTAPLTYLWNFGDELTSTLTSPTHAYTATGSYTVTLTANNAYGTDSVEAVITVTAGPTGTTIFLPLIMKAYTGN